MEKSRSEGPYVEAADVSGASREEYSCVCINIYMYTWLLVDRQMDVDVDTDVVVDVDTDVDGDGHTHGDGDIDVCRFYEKQLQDAGIGIHRRRRPPKHYAQKTWPQTHDSDVDPCAFPPGEPFFGRYRLTAGFPR